MANLQKNWIFQRTTLFAFALLILTGAGLYAGFFDEGTGLFLITLALGALLPEDWVIVRKALEIIAPVLVREIKRKSPASASKKPKSPPAKGRS